MRSRVGIVEGLGLRRGSGCMEGQPVDSFSNARVRVV